jgi:hypothetical protein
MTEEDSSSVFFLTLNKNKIMTSFEISNKIAISIINFILRKKEANTKIEKKSESITYETYNEYDGDIMDYDGMGNYSRFPCETK